MKLGWNTNAETGSLADHTAKDSSVACGKAVYHCVLPNVAVGNCIAAISAFFLPYVLVMASVT